MAKKKKKKQDVFCKIKVSGWKKTRGTECACAYVCMYMCGGLGLLGGDF